MDNNVENENDVEDNDIEDNAHPKRWGSMFLKYQVQARNNRRRSSRSSSSNTANNNTMKSAVARWVLRRIVAVNCPS